MRLFTAVLHENLTRFGYPKIGCLFFESHYFVFGSPGYPLPNSPLKSKFMLKVTDILRKFPFSDDSVSVDFGTNTWCTDTLILWVCLRLDCDLFDDFRVFFQIALHKIRIFLWVADGISVNVCYSKTLLECSFAQLESSIVWKFIEVDIVL